MMGIAALNPSYELRFAGGSHFAQNGSGSWNVVSVPPPTM